MGDSYLFSEFILKEFRGQKYLSMQKERLKIEKIDDVGAVMNVHETNVGGSITNVTIVGCNRVYIKEGVHRLP